MEDFKANVKAVLVVAGTMILAYFGKTCLGHFLATNQATDNERLLWLIHLVPAIITTITGVVHLLIQKCNMKKWSVSDSFGVAGVSGTALWLFSLIWFVRFKGDTLVFETGKILICCVITFVVWGVFCVDYMVNILFRKADEEEHQKEQKKSGISE